MVAFFHTTGDSLLAYCFKETLTFSLWNNSCFAVFKHGFYLKCSHIICLRYCRGSPWGQKQCDADQSLVFLLNVVKCISETFPVVSISYIIASCSFRCWRNWVHNDAISHCCFYFPGGAASFNIGKQNSICIVQIVPYKLGFLKLRNPIYYVFKDWCRAQWKILIFTINIYFIKISFKESQHNT